MPFSFPASPSTGDKSTQNGREYEWSGYAWEIVATPASLNASVIAAGTLDAARLPLATTIAAGAVIVGTGLGVSSGTVSVTYGTNSTSACRGDDSRLSDTRTPTDGSVTTAKLANDAVTYAKIQNVSATDRLLGRSSAGAGDVEEVTCTAAGRALLSGADAAAQRTTLSVQPTASPAFTGTVLVGISSALNSSDGVQVAAANNPGVIIARTAAPSNTNSIAGVNATSYDGAAYVAGATINFRAAENWSSTNHGTDIQFRTTPTGSGGSLTETLRLTGAGQLLVTAGSVSAPGVAVSGDPNTGMYSPGADQLAISTNQTERLLIDASGNIRINGAAAATSAVGCIHIKNGTAPTANITDGVVLFAADVSNSSELRVRDEAGNTTTLSPHAFPLIPDGPSEPMAWAYYSERDGRRINVDMLRVVRLLEQLTGEKLVYED